MNIMIATEEKIWKILEEVVDPEIPVIGVTELGIVRRIQSANDQVEVVITPTYSGCPAMKQIESDIRKALIKSGIPNVKITTSLSPAWTTDWITESGKQKLKAFGIAPPNPTHTVCSIKLFQENEAVQCPRCQSWHTRLISQFGSTACKALYQCNDCKEPFDYFKCH